MSNKNKSGLLGRLFGGSSEEEKPPQDDATIEAADAAPGVPDQPGPAQERGTGAANVIADEEAGADTSDDQPGIEPIIDRKDPAPNTADDNNGNAAAAAEGEKKGGWLSRLSAGLRKSSTNLTDSVTGIFTKRKLDEDTLQELEDLLVQADLGVATATAITDRLSESRYDKAISPDELNAVLVDEVSKVLDPVAKPLTIDPTHKPHIILVVGVNGTGKTTTIGKLANNFTQQGKTVVLAAGDTFRAAAIEQLGVWAERTGAGFVSKETGSDAASLAYEAVEHAQRENADVLMIDTAGRLQNKAGLMEELEKIVRVIRKHSPDAPHDTILSLDATTGQNALRQVEAFKKTAGVTGLVMTKLDGTARGGILVALAQEHQLPIHAIGVGEAIEDLQPFDAKDFARALVSGETSAQ